MLTACAASSTGHAPEPWAGHRGQSRPWLFVPISRLLSLVQQSQLSCPTFVQLWGHGKRTDGVPTAVAQQDRGSQFDPGANRRGNARGQPKTKKDLVGRKPGPGSTSVPNGPEKPACLSPKCGGFVQAHELVSGLTHGQHGLELARAGGAPKPGRGDFSWHRVSEKRYTAAYKKMLIFTLMLWSWAVSTRLPYRGRIAWLPPSPTTSRRIFSSGPSGAASRKFPHRRDEMPGP